MELARVVKADVQGGVTTLGEPAERARGAGPDRA
jgi:hypothetical protein